ncbi:MAG: hypothetical protein JJU02_00795 [Cryomorphaceae bacterium]|nr:hypothetical protein [Cryomorphaceae bacterium]
MKQYIRRFFYFGIGVFLGSLVVMALFGDRDIQCSYFPNDRVLYDMRKKELVVVPYARCIMECVQFPDSNFVQILKESRVNFSQSEAQADKPCKKYLLHWTDADKSEWDILTLKCEDTLRILSLQSVDHTLDCRCP